MAVRSLGCATLIDDIREEFIGTGIDFIDPTDYDWKDGEPTDAQIVAKNKADIARADAVLAVCTEPSTGVGGELEVARVMMKPTVVVVNKWSSPWATYWATKTSDARGARKLIEWMIASRQI